MLVQLYNFDFRLNKFNYNFEFLRCFIKYEFLVQSAMNFKYTILQQSSWYGSENFLFC